MDKNEFSNGEQYFLAPGERVEVTAEELASQRRTPQLVKELVESLYRDKVDLKHFIQAYQLIQDNHITVIGARRVPSETGRQLIIKLYDTIEPYRSLLLETNDHGPYPAREVYDLRCAMVDIIRMYDEYCAAIRDLIVPPVPQQAPPAQVYDSTPSASVSTNAASDDGASIEFVAGETVDETDGALPVGQVTDFSHMRSFTPRVAFDMASLYTFLVDEGVIVNIDEKLFIDCISHAHVNELWEIAGKLRKRNLMQHFFKLLAQGWYSKEWISTCAANLNKDVKHITNPTSSKAVDNFDTKLRCVLKQKKGD